MAVLMVVTHVEAIPGHSDDFVDSTEEDSGTFVVRSIRHGRRKPLKQGQVGFVSVGCILPHHSPITH